MVALLLLARTDALACSCATGLDAVVPTDGATGVATDAAPFLAYSERPGEVRLRDALTGEEVPSTREELLQGDGAVVRIVPDAPLEPGRTYVIDGESGYGRAGLPVTFTTGEGPDGDAPPVPVVREVDGGSWSGNGDCGEATYLFLRGEDPPEDAFLEAELAWSEDFSDARTVRGAEASSVMLGWSLCNVTVPELEHGDEVWVRVRAVDLSGHASAWTATEHLHVRAQDGLVGGCSTAPATTAWALLALLVAVRSRRS